MTYDTALTEIKAFAEVYGYVVLQGNGMKENLFTIAKRIGNINAPLCRFMEPEQLSLWLDGYRMGLSAVSPNQE